MVTSSLTRYFTLLFSLLRTRDRAEFQNVCDREEKITGGKGRGEERRGAGEGEECQEVRGEQHGFIILLLILSLQY